MEPRMRFYFSKPKRNTQYVLLDGEVIGTVMFAFGMYMAHSQPVKVNLGWFDTLHKAGLAVVQFNEEMSNEH